MKPEYHKWFVYISPYAHALFYYYTEECDNSFAFQITGKLKMKIIPVCDSNFLCI